MSINELKTGLEDKLRLNVSQKQARKVMNLFDHSGDGFLQEDEMVSLIQFKHRLHALKDEMKSKASASSGFVLANTKNFTTADLSYLTLDSLAKEAQAALTEVAKEQDAIIARGEVIEETLEKALVEASRVVVDVW